MAAPLIFEPIWASGIAVAASATATAGVALPDTPTILITNDTDQIVFVRFGDSGVTAAVTVDLPIGAGYAQVIDKNGATHVSIINATAATGNVYFTGGKGA